MATILRAVILALMVMLIADTPAMAKTKNPPGCKNSSPTAHNPNCSGGSGTHVPASPDKPAVQINTVTHGNSGFTSPAAASSGGAPAPAPAPVPVTVGPAGSGASSSAVVSAPNAGSGAGPSSTPSPSSTVTATPSSGVVIIAPAATPASSGTSAAGGSSASSGSSSGAVSVPVNGGASSGYSAAVQSSASSAFSGAGAGAGSASLTSGAAGGADGEHGQVLSGYNSNIVPANPLHSPDIVSQMRSSGASNSNGNVGGVLPTRIEQVGPTDVVAGQYAAPVSGFGHEEGNTFGQTGELGYKFVHVQEYDGFPRFDSHMPPKPGKNLVPGYRAVLVSSDGVSTCVMSGMGRRTVVNQNGNAISLGHAETLHFRSSSTAHLPSNHQMASHCLVSIRK